MCKFIFLFCFLLSSTVFGQNKILFIGNISQICYEESLSTIELSSDLPDSLASYSAIFLFSSAQSILNEKKVEQLLQFLNNGNGLYLGSENWPLQAESNVMTNLLFSKNAWGDFNEPTALLAEKGIFEEMKSIPAGTTTVAFPLDYRLKVEAWVNDEPLILSGEYYKGKIIIDGGYSRFYCNIDKEGTNNFMLNQFIDFLTKP
ncbi:MAG: hypothetical protein RI883_264 [Bacteroidota bacterium]|jgi:hypothetical protein